MKSNFRGSPQRRTSCVGRLVAPFGHGLVQQVRQAELPGVELGLHAGDGRVAGRELAGEFLGARQQRAGVLALALGHADGLGVGIALGAHAVRLDLRGLAALLERVVGRDVERESAAREIGGDRRRIGAQ